MSKFSAQKYKLLKQYQRSPRCVKNLNPNQKQRQRQSGLSCRGKTFYSWKNYLNADIDRYYNMIMSRKSTEQVYSERGRGYHTRTDPLDGDNSFDDNYSENININKNKIQTLKHKDLENHQNHQNQRNRKTSQKAQIGTNTSIRTFQKYQQSNSVIFSQIQKPSSLYPNNCNINGTSTSQIQKDRSNVSLYIQKQGQLHQQGGRNKSIRLIFSKQIELQVNKPLGNAKMEVSRQSQVREQIQMDRNFDDYHLQLKLKQRQYLMRKFMQHYQQIHDKRL